MDLIGCEMLGLCKDTSKVLRRVSHGFIDVDGLY